MHLPSRKLLFTLLQFNTILLAVTLKDPGPDGIDVTDNSSCDDCKNVKRNVLPDYVLPHCTSGPCPNRTIDTTVLSLLPCTDPSKLSSLKQCDILSSFASYDASSYTNWDPALELFFNLCFVFVESQKDTSFTESIIQFVREDMNGNFGRMNGIIGPKNVATAKQFSKLTGQFFKRITISYSITDLEFENEEEYPMFYATIPTDELINKARLQLLLDFGWRRVAIVASNAKILAANNFIDMAKNTNILPDLRGTYHDDPSTVLKMYKDDDYRIFIAFIEDTEARRVMCEAYHLDLTTENHMWILPGIYDQEWWSNGNNSNNNDYCNCASHCSDDDVLEAGQSTVFVDVPPVYFFSQEKTKEAVELIDFSFLNLIFTIQYFGIDIPENAEKFALHSRAAYVYDAVRIMATAWHHILERLNDSEDEDEDEELCSFLTKPLRLSDNDTLIKRMQQKLDESAYCGLTGYHTFSKAFDRRKYGQVMVTQLQGSSECVVGLYQNVLVPDDACGDGDSNLHVYNPQDPKRSPVNITFYNISHEYNLTEFKFFTNFCSYHWTNNNPFTAPNDGACHGDNCMCYNQLQIAEIVVSGITLVAGIIVVISTVVFNIIFRSNKHVKASSPRFNMLIILGCVFVYPVPLLNSISLSGNLIDEDTRKDVIPLSCELQKWLFYCGVTVILTTMLATNWRIYRIFYNPQIKERRCLSDFVLLFIMMALVVPVVVCLIVWTLYDTYKYYEFSEDYNCPNVDVDDSITTTLITIDCTCRHENIWIGVLLGYDSILCLALVWFSYQISRISSHFAQEGEFAARVTFVSFLFFLPFFTLKLLLSLAVPLILVEFWITFALGILFPSTILGVLFIPKLILIIKEYTKMRKMKIAERRHRALSIVMDKKMKEIEKLESTLRERTNSIRQVERSRTESSLSVGLNNARRPSERSRTDSAYSYRLGSPVSPVSPDALKFKDDVFEQSITFHLK